MAQVFGRLQLSQSNLIMGLGVTYVGERGYTQMGVQREIVAHFNNFIVNVVFSVKGVEIGHST